MSRKKKERKMKINEMKTQLEEENLLTVHVDSCVKAYVPGELVFQDGKWKNMMNVFGVYKGQNDKYCFFITDGEKGIPEYTAVFNSEDEVCNALLEKIRRIDRMNKKNAKKENSKRVSDVPFI